MAQPDPTPEKRKSARLKLATSHLTIEAAHDDFASSARLGPPSRAGDAFMQKPAPLQVALLDGPRSRSYKSCPMMRYARVALALIVVFSISYVLITPDPTDDVYGVLRPNHPAMAPRLLGVSPWESQLPVVDLFHSFTLPTCTPHLATLELLDLLSIWRC